MVRSIYEEYLLKYSYSEDTDIGATDSNWTWGLCCHHNYISLQFLWHFWWDCYPNEVSETQNLPTGERSRFLCSNIGRFWAPLECRDLQDWAPRLHHLHLWGYFWLHIPSLGDSEVQGSYGVYQETSYARHGCNITRGFHHLWVPCIIGYVWIPQFCWFKVVGTGYCQGEVSITNFNHEVRHCGHWAVVQQVFEESWL